MAVIDWVIVGLWFVAGAALWTLLEWLIHNFLGHHGKGKNIFAKEHVQHHATTSYFAPSWKKVGAATIVGTSLWGILSQFVAPLLTAAFVSGLIVMYAAYEIIHRRCHTHPPTGKYSRWIRRHHFYHHFRGPNMNHGVTSALWDMLFNTHVKVAEPIRVPEKHAMDWLVDPETNEVYAKYADDYVIARRGGRRKQAEEPEMIEPPAAIEGVQVAI